MNDTIKVICENGFGELEVPMGTPLLEVAERLTPGLHPLSLIHISEPTRH